jgi:hypothetical protein
VGDTHGLLQALSVLAIATSLSGDAGLAAQRAEEFLARVEHGERW